MDGVVQAQLTPVAGDLAMPDFQVELGGIGEAALFLDALVGKGFFGELDALHIGVAEHTGPQRAVAQRVGPGLPVTVV